jgi:hypothetical protein
MRGALIAAAALAAAVLGPAGPAPAVTGPALGWSDPIAIATTSIAVPPALAQADGRLHVFWLDRAGAADGTGDLWYAVLSADGRTLRSPERLRRGVDTRLAHPVAVSWGRRVVAAWMAREPTGVSVEIAVFDHEGSILTVLRPDPARREEAGRITLAASGSGTPVDAAWSTFDGGLRQVWYARVEAAGEDVPGREIAVSPAQALTTGDAPALLVDSSTRLLWWEPEGAGTFRLMVGDLGAEGLVSRRPLTGALALVAPLPVVPAVVGDEVVLLVPTIERTFATTGRLYAIRPDPTASMARRIPLLGQSRVADLTVARGSGRSVAVWSQPTGRRQNSEVYAARLVPGGGVLDTPSRITLTIPGSLKPAAEVVDGGPVVVWLEVAGFGRFSLSFASSASPRRRAFLLDVPELDLYRPGPSLVFAALVVLSILPIALLVAGVTLVAAAVLVAVVQMLAAPSGRAQDVLDRPPVRLGATLAVTGAIQVAARGFIPGQPHALALAARLICLGTLVVVWTSRRDPAPMLRLLVLFAAVLGGAVVALFAWGAGQLSQF